MASTPGIIRGHLNLSSQPSQPRIKAITFTLLVVMALLLVSGCVSQPPAVERIVSSAYTQPERTSLGRRFAPAIAGHPGKAGFLLLSEGAEAFIKRLALVDNAEQAIDIQYYIWNSDRSGRLLAAHILAAAERGVRVRLLLDDVNVGDRDTALAMLDAHPNIQVRVYNPFRHRRGLAKWLGALAELGRISRRMHNKALLVDGSVAIVGGRNIGDEYFDLHPDLNFRDRDLLAVGPVVRDISDSFDRFWNSDTALSVSLVATEAPSSAQVTAKFAALQAEAAQSWSVGGPYTNERLPATGLDELENELVWAKAELVYDEPWSNISIKNRADTPKRVATALRHLAQQVTTELLVESAYLIPDDFGLNLLVRAREQGIRVRALTNSLASNDLVGNHAGYTRRRQMMLERGAELYELRPDAAVCRNTMQQQAACSDGQQVGLHGKSVVFDRTRVYVGSFNINLRSVYLNTETALIIHSRPLAETVANEIEEHMRLENSWQVKLDADGKLEWQAADAIYKHEPATSWWRRVKSGFLSLFPLEKYL